jgi:hypothetical protein
MKQIRVRTAKSLHRAHPVCDRRLDQRGPIDFRLMYSAQDEQGELIIGDGSVVDISKKGLRIRGDLAVTQGLEMTLFLYLPDGRDPLFVMNARVAWSAGHQFGVEILQMNLRERNRLQYFLSSNHHQ